jgi:hypothetical protein
MGYLSLFETHAVSSVLAGATRPQRLSGRKALRTKAAADLSLDVFSAILAHLRRRHAEVVEKGKA